MTERTWTLISAWLQIAVSVALLVTLILLWWRQ